MSRLDAVGIQEPLTELAAAGLEKLEVFSSIASTNTHLMALPAPGIGRYRVAVADHQTSGRGRHYRRWISAPGAGLCLSCAYTFNRTAAEIEGLTLAIGVGTVSALGQLAVQGVSLKWPNDIVALDGKLGGILTELRAGGPGNATVVTGIGVNVSIEGSLDLGAESRWAQRPVDLKSVTHDPPDRELLAVTLVEHLYRAFRHFDEVGLAGFVDEWRRYDWLRGREITVDMAGRHVPGVAAGLDDRGAVLVDTPGIDEIDGQERERAAREAALRSDLLRRERADLHEVAADDVAGLGHRPVRIAMRAADRFGNDLSKLVAPPYDVLDEDDKAALLAKDPSNIVAVDLPHVPPKSAGPRTR